MKKKSKRSVQTSAASSGWDVISPDGFSIRREGPFKTQYEAQLGLIAWMKRYEQQGYYSTVKDGKRVHISLDDLPQHCKFVELKKRK